MAPDPWLAFAFFQARSSVSPTTPSLAPSVNIVLTCDSTEDLIVIDPEADECFPGTAMPVAARCCEILSRLCSALLLAEFVSV